MQLNDAATILAGADFFDFCTDEERRMLAFTSERKRYAAGTVILSSGEVPEGAQVLISGSLSILQDEAGKQTPKTVSQSGAVISGVSLIVERPRRVTVTAVTIVEILLIPRSSFMRLANQSPDLAGRAAARIRQDLVGFISAVAPLRRKIPRD